LLSYNCLKTVYTTISHVVMMCKFYLIITSQFDGLAFGTGITRGFEK